MPRAVVRLRTVVDGEKFKWQLKELGDIKRIDEILEGVVFALARSPEVIGQPTANPNVWAVPTARWTGVSLVIYYSFDSRQVVLEAVTVADIELN